LGVCQIDPLVLYYHPAIKNAYTHKRGSHLFTMTNSTLDSRHKHLIDTAVRTVFNLTEWQFAGQMGGLSSATLYKITAAGQTYVVRINGHDHTPQQFAREHAAMTLAASQRLAPAVQFADAENGVLMMDFIADQSIYAFNLADPARLAKMAQFIRLRSQSSRLCSRTKYIYVPLSEI